MYKVIQSITQFLTSQATFIKRNRIIRYSGMTASFVLFVLAILTAFPIVIKDNETIAAAPKASDTVLAMTTGSENAAVDITVSSASGTFASSDSTKTAKFSVTTNNYTGYTLTIAGTDDTGLLTNTDTSITTNNTLSSISSATSADTFSSSTALNGKWGYQPSKYGSSANTSFLPAPTTTASILDATGTANPTTPNNYTIGVGARVDYSKPAGTYANTFVLAVVGNPVPYIVNYNDNSGDSTVTNMPAATSGNSSFTNVTLSNTIPTRTGYTFKKWCSSPTTDSGTVCPSGASEYSAGSSLDFIDQTAANNSIELYAVWTIKSGDPYERLEDGDLTMQEMGTLSAENKISLISQMSDGTSYNSDDERDEQTYTVAKINNKVWMTRNLAIGCDGSGSTYGSSVSSESLTSELSNVFTNWSTPTAGLNNGDSYTTPYMTCDSTYGAWYNYAAATAGTIIGENNDANASYDICPKGWRLPTENEITDLVGNGYNPYFNPVLGGAWSGGTQRYAGDSGTWWGSSSVMAGPYAWHRSALIYDSDSHKLLVSDGDSGDSGLYVRCILDPPATLYEQLEDGDLTMQKMGALNTEDKVSLISQMSDGTSYNSDDERDEQTYTIAKINNKVWMTRNLAIGCDGSGSTYGSATSAKSLSSELSNLSTSWSTPTVLLSGASSSTQTADYTDPRMQCNSTYGAWYNYAAASAGTITGSSNYNDATYDICPKGWKLPTEFDLSKLANASNSTTLFDPIVGGYYKNGSLTSTDTGYWWSATRYGSGDRYWLSYYYNGLASFTKGVRYYGGYVRCVLDYNLSEALYTGALNMQDMGRLSQEDKNSLLSIMSEGTSYNSDDERDQQTYTVAKIGDDIWMTRNLAIGCNGSGATYGDSISSKTLSAALSNVSSSTLWPTPTAGLDNGDSNDIPYMTCDSTYGAWYNYAAASAGTITDNSPRDTLFYDICPSGWRLPSVSESNELINVSDSNTLFNPIAGGRYRRGTLEGNSLGWWWSATLGTSGRRGNLTGGRLHQLIIDYEHRYYGEYVRCIFDRPSTAYEKLQNGRLYMQEIGELSQQETNSLLSQMQDGVSYDSTDDRDHQTYTIAKINNKIWMTRNLAIGCDGSGYYYGNSTNAKELYPSSSNINHASEETYVTPTVRIASSVYDEDYGYEHPAMNCDSTYGAWYNYAAATAGAITGDGSNTTQAPSDVCPKGWRLPIYSELDIASYSSEFSPVAGGMWDIDGNYNTGYGQWWSSQSTGGWDRDVLQYDGSGLTRTTNFRVNGAYVRCIKN